MLHYTIEGMDGSGKTTQVDMLRKALRRDRLTAKYTREPGGTKVGKKLRELVLSVEAEKYHPFTELAIMLADQKENYEKEIKPALALGKIVVSDRYIDSAYVYQGYIKEGSYDFCKKIYNLFEINSVPDITFILDCDPDVCIKRIEKRVKILKENKRTAELKELRNDLKPREFHEAIRKGFLLLSETEKERTFVILDATEGRKALHEKIYNIISSSLCLKKLLCSGTS